MSARFIVVERCSPKHCPECNPDSYRQKNYCGLRRVKDGDVIDPRVKTFPKFCPLKKIESCNVNVQDVHNLLKKWDSTMGELSTFINALDEIKKLRKSLNMD